MLKSLFRIFICLYYIIINKQLFTYIRLKYSFENKNIFIFGSGNSVNEINLNSPCFNENSLIVTINLSFNLVGLVPDIIFIETKNNEIIDKLIFDTFREKYYESNLSNSYIMLHESFLRNKYYLDKYRSLSKNVIIYRTIKIPIIQKYCKSIDKTLLYRIFDPLFSYGCFLSHQSSLDRLILYFLRCNVKNIILCGIDLKNSCYYWSNTNNNTYKKINAIITDNSTHNTISKKNVISVHHFLRIMNLFCSKRSIGLYTFSNSVYLSYILKSFLFRK